jgi:hypothetical protein
VRAKRKPRSHITYSRECRRVWGNEPSHSQGNSHFRRWSLGGFPKLQRAIWGVKTPWLVTSFCIIENLLERRCLKWARIVHLDIWNTSYGQKKGHESNCQFDSRLEKVGNRPDSLGCRKRAIYRWKALDESYNFALDRTSIQGLLTKLWGSKVAGVLASWKKAIWMWAPWRGPKYTIRGKVVASPKFGPWWVLCVFVAHGSS